MASDDGAKADTGAPAERAEPPTALAASDAVKRALPAAHFFAAWRKKNWAARKETR